MGVAVPGLGWIRGRGLYKTEQKIINTHIPGTRTQTVASELFSLTAVLQTVRTKRQEHAFSNF
jgi:hypothetical protein